MSEKMSWVLVAVLITCLLLVVCAFLTEIGGTAIGEGIGKYVAQPESQCSVNADCVDQSQVAVQVGVINNAEQDQQNEVTGGGVDEESTVDKFLGFAESILVGVALAFLFASFMFCTLVILYR